MLNVIKLKGTHCVWVLTGCMDMSGGDLGIVDSDSNY